MGGTREKGVWPNVGNTRKERGVAKCRQYHEGKGCG